MLKYTKLKTYCTILVFQGFNNHIAVIIQVKKMLVLAHVFPKVSSFQKSKYKLG